MNKAGDPDFHERMETEKQPIALHPFDVENEIELNSGMAFDVQKWNPDGRLRPFLSARMGSESMKIGHTRPYSV